MSPGHGSAGRGDELVRQWLDGGHDREAQLVGAVREEAGFAVACGATVAHLGAVPAKQYGVAGEGNS